MNNSKNKSSLNFLNENGSSGILDSSHSTKNRIYQTELGEAWVGNSRTFMKKIASNSLDLVITSPPYALTKKKSYGNVEKTDYLKWFRGFATEIHRVLKDSGSFVLNIGGSWVSSEPVKSLYVYKLLLDLCEPHGNRSDKGKFFLAQDFYWFNPAKIPNPTQWVTVKRVRVKDAVEHVWWLSKTPNPKADNRRVIAPYSKSMERLIRTGRYNKGMRPSGWQVSDDWAVNNKGAIPPNLLPPDLLESPHEQPNLGIDEQFNMFAESNTSSNDLYRSKCRENGINSHPAIFPKVLPEFFIRYLTEPGDIVLDPFAGSNTTGKAADDLGRRWVSVDKDRNFVKASRFRWEDGQTF
tara:strand:- start:1703 stop:2758 length:1056 start_codon:yes stop_codon:yes gene_type:complete